MALKNFTKSNKTSAQDALVTGSDEGYGLRASSDTSAVGRTGLWVLGLGVGGFLLWAGLAPLDEGVPTPPPPAPPPAPRERVIP
jgi:protease secretion system membrane fusion protein